MSLVKALHALDTDVHTVCAEPVSGDYELTLNAVEDRSQPLGGIRQVTDPVQRATPLPTRTSATVESGENFS